MKNIINFELCVTPVSQQNRQDAKLLYHFDGDMKKIGCLSSTIELSCGNVVWKTICWSAGICIPFVDFSVGPNFTYHIKKYFLKLLIEYTVYNYVLYLLIKNFVFANMHMNSGQHILFWMILYIKEHKSCHVVANHVL